MSDKELIKQKIERLLKENEHNQHNDSIQVSLDKASKYRILYELLQFIDSLSEEPTSEDLEEEIDKFEDWANNFNQSDYPTSYTVRDIARHFTEWQKQQMMKDAVDATVHKGLYSKYVKEQDSDALNKALEKYIPGDKVKIIIMKEEQ